MKGCVEHLAGGDWQEAAGHHERLIILIACPTVADLLYAKRRAKKEIEDSNLDEDEASCIRFATIEKIKQLGVVAKVWEEV